VSAELFREVDGFDEAFLGYGKEDSDLRNRMRNAGARGISLWGEARVCHLFWPRPFGSGRDQPGAEVYDKWTTRVRARRGLSSHGPGELSA
jgi:GT2 family glycosyltransferase